MVIPVKDPSPCLRGGGHGFKPKKPGKTPASVMDGKPTHSYKMMKGSPPEFFFLCIFSITKTSSVNLRYKPHLFKPVYSVASSRLTRIAL